MKIKDILVQSLNEASVAAYAKQPFRAIGNLGTNIARGFTGQSKAAGRNVKGQFTKVGALGTAAYKTGQGAQAAASAVSGVLDDKPITKGLGQLSQVLQPYTGSSMFVGGTSSSGKYVPVGATFNNYSKTEDGWVDSNGSKVGDIYQKQLDKLWNEQSLTKKQAQRTPAPATTAAPAPATTPTPTAKTPQKKPQTTTKSQSVPPPQVKVPNGEIITKYGTKWYDEEGSEIVNSSDIAKLEKLSKSQQQTRQMAKGGTAAQKALLVPKKQRQAKVK